MRTKKTSQKTTPSHIPDYPAHLIRHANIFASGEALLKIKQTSRMAPPSCFHGNNGVHPLFPWFQVLLRCLLIN